MNKRIEIEVTNTAQDYRRVLLWYYQKKLLIAGVLYLIIIISMSWFIFFGAGANPFEAKNSSLISLVIALAFLPILIAVSIFIGIHKQAKMIEQTLRRTSFIFSDTNIESYSEISETKVAWEMIQKVKELKQDFLFYPQKNIFYTIPKRFFQSENQIIDFKNLLREKLGAKAKLEN